MLAVRRSLATLGVLTLVALGGASAHAQTSPALETPRARLDAAVHCPATFADRAREPVLLVHGTFTDDNYNFAWNYLPALQNLGYDVCTVTLPDHSLGDMQIQAEYVVHAVRVMAARSGERVDIVGSSQGTLHPRWAVRWWPDVRASVDDLVQLAAPNHGTSVTAFGTSFGRCFASCWQMRQGSDYINALNAGDPTPDGVDVTSLYTLTDELVQPQLPTSTSALEGASNIPLQSLCPGRPVDHVTISTGDAVGFALTVDALEHEGPADPGRFEVTTCLQPFIPTTNPLDLLTTDGSASFQGQYVDGEPPLKAYARGAASAGASPLTPGVSDAGAEVLPAALPASGADVLGLGATGVTAVALGLALLSSADGRRGAPTAAPSRRRRAAARR